MIEANLSSVPALVERRLFLFEEVQVKYVGIVDETPGISGNDDRVVENILLTRLRDSRVDILAWIENTRRPVTVVSGDCP